jgi:hypothetical protein
VDAWVYAGEDVLKELAAAEKINPSYISRLTLLAPYIVEAILDGRPPVEMTLPGVLNGVAVEWSLQNEALRGRP